MSKSTPLSQLPNSDLNSQSNDKENQLVNDILNEIDKDTNQNNDQQIEQQRMQEQMQQQQMQQQQMQQQMQQQQMQQQLENQKLEQMKQAEEAKLNNELEKELKEIDNNDKSMFDKILDLSKQPLIVAALIIVFSIPKLNNIIASILPKKELFLNNPNIFIPVIKGLFGGVLFMVINNNI